MNYIAYLHKDSRSDFGVSFPDFPGCVTAGKTLEEARHMAVEALSLHVQGMLEDGEDIPEPSTLDDLAQHSNWKGSVAVLISLAWGPVARVIADKEQDEYDHECHGRRQLRPAEQWSYQAR